MANEKHNTRDGGGRFASTASARPPLKRGKGMGSYASMSTPGLNRKKSQHVIDDISYSQDFIVCICAWKGAIDSYQAHRKAAEPPRVAEGVTK